MVKMQEARSKHASIDEHGASKQDEKSTRCKQIHTKGKHKACEA